MLICVTGSRLLAFFSAGVLAFGCFLLADWRTDVSDTPISLINKTFQHKKYGEVTVEEVRKRGRGWNVLLRSDKPEVQLNRQRLKDFEKAVRGL